MFREILNVWLILPEDFSSLPLNTSSVYPSFFWHVSELKIIHFHFPTSPDLGTPTDHPPSSDVLIGHIAKCSVVKGLSLHPILLTNCPRVFSIERTVWITAKLNLPIVTKFALFCHKTFAIAFNFVQALLTCGLKLIIFCIIVGIS